MLSPSNSHSWLFGLIRSYVPLLPLRFVDIYWEMGNTYTFHYMPLSIFKIFLLSIVLRQKLPLPEISVLARSRALNWQYTISIDLFINLSQLRRKHFPILTLLVSVWLIFLARQILFPFAFQCFDSSLWTRVENLQTLHPGQYDMASLNIQHSSPRPSTSSRGLCDLLVHYPLTR